MKYSVEKLLAIKKNWSKDDFIFFWVHRRTDGINKGCFSQWWPCKFTVNGVTYNSAEQYMMAQKAILFQDTKTLRSIMLATTPNVCKFLGRQVKGFDSKIWNDNCYNIVLHGNIAKFSQNEELKIDLVATKGKYLVEASPYDHIWGIGMSKDHPDCGDPSKWKGTNLLGFALTEARDLIMKGRKQL